MSKSIIMDAFEELEQKVGEITFVSAYSVIFSSKTLNIVDYRKSRCTPFNSTIVEKAWNNILVSIQNDDYKTFNTILQSAKFNDIQTAIKESIAKMNASNKKSEKKPKTVCNSTSSEKAKNAGFINQIGLALRDKMNNDNANSNASQKESQSKDNKELAKIVPPKDTDVEKVELENIALDKFRSKSILKSAKLRAKENVKADEKNGVEEKLSVEMKESESFKMVQPVKKNESDATKSADKAMKKREKKKRQKRRKKEQINKVNKNNAAEVEVKDEEEEEEEEEEDDDNEDEEIIEVENERSDESSDNEMDSEGESNECAHLERLKRELRNLQEQMRKQIKRKKAVEQTKITENKKTEVKEDKKKSKEKKRVAEETSDDGYSVMSYESADNEINFEDNENMPAFYKFLYDKSIKKDDSKGSKSTKANDTTALKQKTEDVSPNQCAIESSKKMISELKTVKACIGKACDSTMKGHLVLVVASFNKAIHLDPDNLGHYINRSYYYLRMSSFKMATHDAKYVIQRSNNHFQLALAKFLLGKVYCDLNNFEAAEKLYEESLNLNPDDKTVLRELLELRMKQLVYMGFTTKSVLAVLRETDVLAEACEKLFLKSETKEEESTIVPITDETEIYYSDDENDNIVSLTNLTNYYYTRNKNNHNITKNNNVKNNSANNVFVSVNNDKKKNRTGEPCAKNAENIKQLSANMLNMNFKNCEDKTLWIGSLTPAITKDMIKKKFNSYGKIVSIIKPDGDTWAFINFQNPLPFKEIFADGTNFVINNVKVIVRPKLKK